MILNRLLLICSLIVLTNSCNNNDHFGGSFQLSVTIDTTRASIGDLISYKIITQNIGNKYFMIENSQFSEPLELRSTKLLYDKREKVIILRSQKLIKMLLAVLGFMIRT